jgi:hypothetical protein
MGETECARVSESETCGYDNDTDYVIQQQRTQQPADFLMTTANNVEY